MKLFIGDIIQKLRKIKGLTQEQVANALGITTSSVSKWETNNTYPDISLLSPLARLLGTAVDNVFNFKQKLSEEEIDTLLNRVRLDCLNRIIPRMLPDFYRQARTH